MAEPELALKTPLLTHKSTSNGSDNQPHLAIPIDFSSPDQSCNLDTQNLNPNTEYLKCDLQNPFEFLGIDGYPLPPSSTADPFRNHTPRIEGVYEWVKIFLSLPIALLRLLLFGLSLCVGYLATLLALQGWKDRHNPMPRWRCRVMWVTRICARCILFSFGYQWIKRKGRPAPREIAPIVVSNHVSYIDPIFYFYELSPTIVASESHDSLPFVGTIIRAMQVIYVNRFVPMSRKNAVNEIQRKASCNRFPRVFLFPEGTTSNGRFLLSFQMGAFIPGYPIQPVVVRYPYVHFDQSWGNISLMKLMFRMFTQFHNFMEVEYLPVVSPSQSQKESASLFAERTARAVASALNVVQTSLSYGDMLLLMKAHEMKQENPSKFLVELAHKDLDYRINTVEALEFLEKFLSMNPDNSGSVKFEDFVRGFRLKPCALTRKTFDFVDVEKNGKITFKQFLLASTHVLRQPLFERACEFSFAMCCGSSHSYISRKEFEGSIRLVISSTTTDDVDELFNMFDKDGDGKISKPEFLNCLTKDPLLIAVFAPLLPDEFSHVNSNLLEEVVSLLTVTG